MVKVLVNKDNWKETVPIVVMHMRDMEMMCPGTALLTKTRNQYASMARGGNGGLLEYTPEGWQPRPDGWERARYPTVREINYPDAPTEFFQEVCDLLGWER